MRLSDRLAGLDTNLDDLQSCVDAGSREADHIGKTAASIDRLQIAALESANLARALLRHSAELQACVNDQRAALHELRDAMARLRDELTASSAAMPLPPATAAARHGR
jgi:predicted  nucleic acid-binding Zn-ribbon protein